MIHPNYNLPLKGRDSLIRNPSVPALQEIRAATHLAGHAAVVLALQHELLWISIAGDNPRETELSYKTVLHPRATKRDALLIALAGPVAERMFCGTESPSCDCSHIDLEDAMEYAKGLQPPGSDEASTIIRAAVLELQTAFLDPRLWANVDVLIRELLLQRRWCREWAQQMREKEVEATELSGEAVVDRLAFYHLRQVPVTQSAAQLEDATDA